MLVSVIIPCYNQGRFLEESIQSAAAQTDVQTQIIVVDDGSTDDTARIARRAGQAHYLYQRNRGLGAARNTGLRHSAGSFVVFLDADDRLLSGALRAGVDSLERRPDCVFAIGRYRHISADGEPLPPDSPPCPSDELYLQLLRSNRIGMVATVMFRREVVVAAHGFDEKLRACEDYDLYLRLARSHACCAHANVIAEYRRHDAAMSQDAARMLSTGMTVLRRQRRYLSSDRHRAAWLAGLDWVRRSYGDRLLDEFASPHSRRTSRETLRRALIALRYHPHGVMRRTLPRPLRMSSRRSGPTNV